MSKLQDLIDRLCPNGVEFKPLGEVFEMRNGYTPSKNESSFWEDGTIPWFRMEDIRENGRILSDSIQHITPAAVKGKGLFEANTFILATTATIGEHALIIADSLANQRFTNLKVRKSLSNLLETKFVFYYMFIVDEFCKNNTNVSGFASVDMGKLKRMPFPIPPLEVQEEIVRILDRFADYAAELQAELQARKEQYEYYRNLLLTFNPSAYGSGTDDEQKDSITRWGGHSYKIQWKTMGEIGNVKMCKRIMKNQTSSMGDVPFYKIGTFGKEPDAYISRELFEDYKHKYSFPSKGTILISAAGTIGRCVIYDGEDAYFQDSNIVWLENDEKQVLNSYLYYFYQIVDWDTDGGTIKRLYNDKFLATPIPIPPMELQEKIVAILDRFETLVNDLSKGLPAEIEAVKAQYEYYRNKLLTFKDVAG